MTASDGGYVPSVVSWDDALPVVIDTNVMLFEVKRSASRQELTALQFLMISGACRVFVSHQVAAEIIEKFAVVADEQVSEETLRAVWRQRYAPYVRVVDTALLPAESDHRVAGVVDADDLPMAQLVSALTPVISLSKDKHLIEVGLASPEWLQAVLGVGDVVRVDSSAFAAQFLVVMLGQAATSGVRAGLKFALSSPVVAGAFGLALGVTIRGGIDNRDRLSMWGRRVRQMTERALVRVGEVIARRQDARDLLERAAVPPVTSKTLEQEVGRILATSRRPHLTQQLDAESTGTKRLSGRKLRALLEDNPAFHLDEEGRWHLGRTADEF